MHWTAIPVRLSLALISASFVASCSKPAPTKATRLASIDTLAIAKPDAVGMDDSLNTVLDSIAVRAIRKNVAPGMAIAVARYGRLVHFRGYGTTDWAAGSSAVTDSTLYDLASLTKVIATTTAAMILEERGKLNIDHTVHSYLKELSAKPKASITVRMLLTHSGGFEAGAPLYKKYHGQAAYLKQINKRPLQYKPGTGTTYSDWDMVLLQAVIERISGVPLDSFVDQHVFAPLGMRDTRFTPDTSNRQLRQRIAATEKDPARGGLLRGTVDDMNAWALGGVAGHAGLFSSIRDLSVFAEMILNGGSFRGVRILEPETIATWTARQRATSSRALGWDTPANDASSGRYFSTRSIGHTGFTGTSLWIDPERGVFIVLLMNRINSRGGGEGHLQVRRDVSDAIQAAIVDAPLVPWESRLTANGGR